jgi:hypothetical protein
MVSTKRYNSQSSSETSESSMVVHEAAQHMQARHKQPDYNMVVDQAAS